MEQETPNQTPDTHSHDQASYEESVHENILLNPDELKVSSASRVPVSEILKDQEAPLVSNTKKEQPSLAIHKEEGLVRSLQTYQGDIQDVVQKKSVSVVSIAAAEAMRRSKEPFEQKTRSLGSTLLIIAGIILILASVAVGVYFYTIQHTVPKIQAPVSQIINVDETQTIIITPSMTSTDILQKLQTARTQNSIPIGLVERLLFSQTNQGLDGQTFLSLLAPRAPQALIRDIQPVFVLGLYSYSGNYPFIILKVDSYELGFSGMLAWEKTMQDDLSPFFGNPSVATSSSTSTQQILNTPFTDAVFENHDARVIHGQDGNPSLLWTFLNPTTVAITTNAATLHEIISRLTQ